MTSAQETASIDPNPICGALCNIIPCVADGGFAVAWKSSSETTGLDVYAQRFIEATISPRKECLNSAKGLRGHERKAFMTACLR